MTIQLPAALQTTHDSLFQHPVSRRMEWLSVRSLLEWLSDLTEDQGDQVRFTRNGQTMAVRRPLRKIFSDVRQLMKIRDFITTSLSATPPTATSPTPVAASTSTS
jgi:hypothetical protein